MNNHRIAARFLEIADHLERYRANVFRIRAYQQGARTLERLKQDVSELVRRGSLEQIQGIGPDLSARILEFLETGRISDPPVEDKPPAKGTTEFPPVFKELVESGVLNSKTAYFLHRRFFLETFDDLEQLVRSRLLRTLHGFGAQEERKLLKDLEAYKKVRGES